MTLSLIRLHIFPMILTKTFKDFYPIKVFIETLLWYYIISVMVTVLEPGLPVLLKSFVAESHVPLTWDFVE